MIALLRYRQKRKGQFNPENDTHADVQPYVTTNPQFCTDNDDESTVDDRSEKCLYIDEKSEKDLLYEVLH